MKYVKQNNYLALDTTDAVAVKQHLTAIEQIGSAIKSTLIEGINNDYAVIRGTNKPTLLQPGARKIMQMFGLRAEFSEIEMEKHGNSEMFKVKCSLILLSNEKKISESYGYASPSMSGRDMGGNYNAGIKMAQKRAMVGAVLQIANLSKVFTQDMEDAKSVSVSVNP